MTLNFSNLTRDFPDVEVSNIGSCSFSITYKWNMRVIGEMLEFTCTSKDGQRQLGGIAAKFETA
jgi:hypothetical protein